MHAKGEFKLFIRQKISGFPPTNHLAHVQIGLTPGPSKDHVPLLAKMDSNKRGLRGWKDILWTGVPSLLWLLRIFSAHVWCEISLTQNEKHVASLSFTQGEISSSLLLPYFYLEVSTGEKFQVFSLGSNYLLSQYYLKVENTTHLLYTHSNI